MTSLHRELGNFDYYDADTDANFFLSTMSDLIGDVGPQGRCRTFLAMSAIYISAIYTSRLPGHLAGMYILLLL